ncbi:MAG TPA: PHB depolymerase family esterase, partial [Chitinophagaceae bacterium]|nr:PHB depolymerase family esterase [Chitinophagaceae bacterium]
MKIVFAFILLILSLSLHAQDLNEYKKEIFIRKSQVLPYRILYPLSFDTGRKYPLLIFLHGAYEKGNDNEAQLDIGGRYFLADSNRRNFPAVIIFPQCPSNDVWAYFDAEFDSMGVLKRAIFPFRKEPTAVTSLLKQLVDSLMSSSFIDISKIYVGGLSQGGMGVFDIVARYPNIFAAAFPICGAGKVSTADKFAKQTALWIFHGADDDVVPVHFSRQFYQKLKKLGGDVKYTEY